MGLLHPLGNVLKCIDPKLYSKIRWKMRSIMGDPMNQHFLLPFIVNKGEIVIDIGANTGQFTLPLANLVGKNGVVHAFEPVSTTFNELKKNINREKLSSRVILNQLGLGDSIEFKEITIPEDRPTEASLITHTSQKWIDYKRNSSKYVIEKCKIITLDHYVKDKRIKDITFIKCDVEGGEFQVLKGANKTLKSPYPPVLMLEVYEAWTKDFGYHPRDLFGYLKKMGYEFYWIYKSGLRRFDHDSEDIPGIFWKWVDYLCIIPEIHKNRINLKSFLN